MKKVLSFVICFILVAGFFVGDQSEEAKAADSKQRISIVRTNKELRGLWIAFYDFQDLGLKSKTKKTFTSNADKIMKKAKQSKCNAVFVHVRAFDDAIWKSKTFNASEYLVSSSKAKKKANKAYSYDPLKIICQRAKKYGLEVHAWMNPYRITYTRFYDPKYASSRNRVITAISEVSKYDVCGIHFDDYFYHSKGGYVKTRGGSSHSAGASAKQKRTNVNKLIKQSYKASHARGMVFGVSPQGNYDNDMNDGADVKTWYSKTGYVDYVCPQIYWTDNWGSKGKTKMFTQRLDKFSKLNKYPKKIKTYVGLAMYRTGYSQSDDRGWGWRSTNLKNQLTKIRKATYKNRGVRGYILFDTGSLFKSRCQKELKNMKNAI